MRAWDCGQQGFQRQTLSLVWRRRRVTCNDSELRRLGSPQLLPYTSRRGHPGIQGPPQSLLHVHVVRECRACPLTPWASCQETLTVSNGETWSSGAA